MCLSEDESDYQYDRIAISLIVWGVQTISQPFSFST